MRITDVEIDELIRIVESSNFYYGIGVGDEPYASSEGVETFCCEVGDYIKISENEGYFEKGTFSEETKKLIHKKLKDFNGIVFLFPQGTHCGSLIFLTGWVHEEGRREEELEEAVMPQRGL